MAITNLDTLFQAMKRAANNSVSKASLSSAVAGHEMSLWRATGIPAQGAIPTAAAVCSNALLGSMPLASRTGTEERVLSWLAISLATLYHTIVIEDRLAHMGGLNGTLTTPQTVGIDISVATNNLPNRVGAADFSEVKWYLEWYAATGATVATPTAQVTYTDNTTDNCNIWVLGATALPATVGASRRYQIIPNNGKIIKSMQSLTLSASTATAGNFGVTAVKQMTKNTQTYPVNVQHILGWDLMNAPMIADQACLQLAMIAATTTTGAVGGDIVQSVA